MISSIIIPEFSTGVSNIFSCCLTCRFAYGWTGWTGAYGWTGALHYIKSKIPIEIICFVNSATYTLQVPNVTRNKHVFQVCIETCYPNIEVHDSLRKELGDTEARLYVLPWSSYLPRRCQLKTCFILRSYKKPTWVASRSLSFEFEKYKWFSLECHKSKLLLVRSGEGVGLIIM